MIGQNDKIPELRKEVNSRLSGGLWHVTHPDRFLSIRNEGLQPEPRIPDSARFDPSIGPEEYPYVRSIGGVSFFDFRDVSPRLTSGVNSKINWRNFITFSPFPQRWGGGVWINIDGNKISNSFISGPDAVVKWKQDNQCHRKLMPYIEGGHIGVVPPSAFLRAFLVDIKGIRDVGL